MILRFTMPTGWSHVAKAKKRKRDRRFNCCSGMKIYRVIKRSRTHRVILSIIPTHTTHVRSHMYTFFPKHGWKSQRDRTVIYAVNMQSANRVR